MVRVFMAAIVLAISISASQAETVSLGASNCLTKVMRTDLPGAGQTPLRMSGARGEIVSGQAVFRWPSDLAGVTARMTELRHRQSDATIPASAIKLQWVRYIDVTRNSAGVPRDELVALAPTSIPDPFWEDDAIPVQGGQSQPIWIDLHVPPGAEVGDYEGKLVLLAEDELAELPVALHVWNFDLPEQRHLSVVNWWSFPGLGFRDKVKPYTEQYWELLAKFSEFLVEHRQTDVNSYIGLITEQGDAEDGYRYDTSRLERYAEVVFGAGIRRIHLHALGHRTAHVLDPASLIEPDEKNFRRLPALEQLIRRRNWQDRFLVTIADEPFIQHEQSYAALVDRVHDTAPGVRCIEAVETTHLGKLDIYVPKLSHLNLWYPQFDRKRREGAELWFYTCCHPVGRYPNRFLDQSLLKVRVLHWLNYRYDLKGYLHWGLNQFYGDDPYSEDGLSHGLPLGDRAIAYPGKAGLLSSLRFDAQRDGIEDFEYLWVLENRLAKLKDRLGAEAFWLDPRQRPLELCRRVVRSFHDTTRNPDVLLETRRAIAEEIEALDETPLLVVQTSPVEGTVVPAGPRQMLVRGLAPPGAKVTINGQPACNVRPSGYFLHEHFLADDQPTITVVVEHNGKTRTAVRTFPLAD